MDSLILQNGSQAVSRCMFQNGSGNAYMPLPLVVLPTMLYFARSYSTSFVGMAGTTNPAGSSDQSRPQGQELIQAQQQQFPFPLPPPLQLALGQRPTFPPGSPPAVAAAAFDNSGHKVVQRLLSFLPDVVLTWFFTRVLELSPETTRETVAMLRSKKPAKTSPLLSALLGIEEAGAGAQGETALVQAPAQQQQQVSRGAMVVHQQQEEWVMAEQQEYQGQPSHAGNVTVPVLGSGDAAMDAMVREKAMALAEEILAQEFTRSRGAGVRRERQRQTRKYGASRRGTAVGVAS